METKPHNRYLYLVFGGGEESRGASIVYAMMMMGPGGVGGGLGFFYFLFLIFFWEYFLFSPIAGRLFFTNSGPAFEVFFLFSPPWLPD